MDLTITNTTIRQDNEGRYCLNDLHKAAGGQERHKPHRWLRNQQTKGLITAINRKYSETKYGLRNPVATITVGAPTTYVVKQLVYAYAMWISPEFNLQVVEAYDAMVAGEFIRPAIQQENYWFSRRPTWPPIRERVLLGQRYKEIAAALSLSRGQVARAVRRMIEVGLLSPSKVAATQIGPARRAARMLAQGWGMQVARQLSLFPEVQA